MASEAQYHSVSYAEAVSDFLHVRAEYRGPRSTIRSVLRYTQLLSNSER
ncbi:MAG TPA: hypothetical protein VNL98_04880 [Gemmatimonadales bacterium]|nr:hypothetical protein [Gemmatimonadales bacterium]